MSPEAWRGQLLDAQADVWSLGVMVYQMVSGQLPFAGDTLPVVMTKVLTEAPPDLRALRPQTPEALVRIIERMLARDKADRYRTMRQVAVDLEEIQLDMRQAQGEENRKKEEAGRKQEEEARRRVEAELQARKAQEEAKRKQEEENQRVQAEARRQADAEQQTRVLREQEEARLEQQYATRLPEDYIPTEVPDAKAYPYGTLSDHGAKKPRSWSKPAIVGVGALVLVGLLVTASLGLWAAGKFLAPATFTATATRTFTVGATKTPIPLTSTPSPRVTPQPPADTATPVPPTFTASPTLEPPTLTPVPTLGIGSTQVYADNMVGVYVPAGDFLMGSTDADIYAGSNEKPQHTVYLDAYWIDQTDVTNAQFARFVAATRYQTDAEIGGSGYVYDLHLGNWSDIKGANWQHPRGPSSDLQGLDQHPVVQVSWNDAIAYCQWAGRRLPTEAEWEKAARGKDGRIYPWGNQAPDATLANSNSNVGTTTEVGKYLAGVSPYGALDMAGNVWQWVNDWSSDTYYSSSPGKNPTGPTSGQVRVLRGGSWYYGPGGVRAANRDGYGPARRNVYSGFRCVRSP